MRSAVSCGRSVSISKLGSCARMTYFRWRAPLRDLAADFLVVERGDLNSGGVADLVANHRLPVACAPLNVIFLPFRGLKRSRGSSRRFRTDIHVRCGCKLVRYESFQCERFGGIGCR